MESNKEEEEEEEPLPSEEGTPSKVLKILPGSQGQNLAVPVVYVARQCGGHSGTSRAPSAASSAGTASERRGNTLTGFKDFYLKAKARIWPRKSNLLPAVCRCRANLA